MERTMMAPYDWDELTEASEAADRAVREVVMRHRCSGVLTWSLLHRMEGEVLAQLEAGGEHSAWTLNMIRSAPVLGYPNDDRPVSFSNASIVPIIFGQIEDAWSLVH
jgi:hypothetical protein